jgi:hypothetical protein
VKRIQALSTAKGLQEVVSQEVAVASECSGKWVENLGKCLEICVQTQNDLLHWASDSVTDLNKAA